MGHIMKVPYILYLSVKIFHIYSQFSVGINRLICHFFLKHVKKSVPKWCLLQSSLGASRFLERLRKWSIHFSEIHVTETFFVSNHHSARSFGRTCGVTGSTESIKMKSKENVRFLLFLRWVDNPSGVPDFCKKPPLLEKYLWWWILYTIFSGSECWWLLHFLAPLASFNTWKNH